VAAGWGKSPRPPGTFPAQGVIDRGVAVIRVRTISRARTTRMDEEHLGSGVFMLETSGSIVP
jgi:hypothetical protein